ncbi:MAG: aminotransferase class V-fold PLP-dependent enzyme [Cyanobacteria bacterium P01_A01_bin.37]
MMERPIYLDCHSTTPVDERVFDAMRPYFTQYFGNPSSTMHHYGWEAEAAVTRSRAILADSIDAIPEEIILTSGATEANNLAIKGVAEAYMSRGQHIITVQTEHSAVLEPCDYLQSLGFEVTFLPVQPDGLLSIHDLEDAIRSDTILVSVMAANNEIGVLQPLQDIGQCCREHGVLFHTDAAQAIGKIPLDVDALSIDLLSMTAHKIYGPKGIGALYVRRRNPRVQIAPQLHGGGQERGLRGGTLYTPQIVGFAEAMAIAIAEMESESQRLCQLRDQLWQSLQVLDGVMLNGHPTQRLPGNLNISIDGVDVEALLLGIQSAIAISTGSACASAQMKPSHVLTALGLSEHHARSSLRFGIGRFNTPDDIHIAWNVVVGTVRTLRQSILSM